MMRTTTTRSLPRAFSQAAQYKSSSITLNAARFTSIAYKAHKAVASLPKASLASQLRWSTSGYSVKPGAPQLDKVDKEAEKKLAAQKLEVDPEGVTGTSSTTQVFESAPKVAKEAGGPEVPENEVLGGIKADLVGSHMLHSKLSQSHATTT